jgi:hypothetical protein
MVPGGLDGERQLLRTCLRPSAGRRYPQEPLGPGGWPDNGFCRKIGRINPPRVRGLSGRIAEHEQRATTSSAI